MAKPVEFPEVNVRWFGEGDVGGLPAYRDEQCSISCWKLGWRERIWLLLIGRVWLHVWTKQHPAVYVSGDYPFSNSSMK